MEKHEPKRKSAFHVEMKAFLTKELNMNKSGKFRWYHAIVCTVVGLSFGWILYDVQEAAEHKRVIAIVEELCVIKED